MRQLRLRGEILVGILLMFAGLLAIVTFVLALIIPRLHTPYLDTPYLDSPDLDPTNQLIKTTAQPAQVLAPEISRPTPMLPTPMALDASDPVSSLYLDSDGNEIPRLLPESPLTTEQIGNVQNNSMSKLGLFDASLTQPFRLVIPDLYIDAPIRPVSMNYIEDEDDRFLQWSVPNDFAAGWHESSAPLGQPGNTILNGHNNVHGAIFRNLVDLELGAEIVLHDANQSYTYEVTGRELFEEDGQPLKVRLDNARWMLPTSDERITIISCWPLATNSHRIVVIAHPVNSNGS